MARRVWTVARVEDIQRLIAEGHSDRQIARTLRCRRTRVGEIRELGTAAVQALSVEKVADSEPAWALLVDWTAVEGEIRRGFELKRIWEERAASLTSNSNFWKYLSRRFAWLLKHTVTLREFDPGTHCEVDWAGDKIAWWDKSGHRREAHVFVGILCYSQLIFAGAFADERRPSWLAAHQKMYAAFKGVPRVTVPDNPKTGVKRAHLYDPDLNPAYAELARHYGTAVIPARVRRPRDKALVENAVGLVMRLFRWVYRNRKFHSLAEIIEALAAVVERINTRPHSRYRVSRVERFETLERAHLKALPATPFEDIEWRQPTVHPDSTVAVDSATYSVPHIHRGKEVRVKLTARQVEVFLNLERIALHPRDRSRSGARIIDPAHLPPNSQAYRETTPSNVLSQARFLSTALHGYIDDLFQEDTLAHLRRAQGYIRHARDEINRFGRAEAEPRIAETVAQMKRFGNPRVAFMAEQITRFRKTKKLPAVAREITRIPGNPMLRGTYQTAEESRAHDQQQMSLLPERTETHEYDAGQASNAGT
jgi:transposase